MKHSKASLSGWASGARPTLFDRRLHGRQLVPAKRIFQRVSSLGPVMGHFLLMQMWPPSPNPNPLRISISPDLPIRPLRRYRFQSHPHLLLPTSTFCLSLSDPPPGPCPTLLPHLPWASPPAPPLHLSHLPTRPHSLTHCPVSSRSLSHFKTLSYSSSLMLSLSHFSLSSPFASLPFLGGPVQHAEGFRQVATEYLHSYPYPWLPWVQHAIRCKPCTRNGHLLLLQIIPHSVIARNPLRDTHLIRRP